jgi:hypothetical protein
MSPIPVKKNVLPNMPDLVLKDGVMHMRTKGADGQSVLTPLKGEEAAKLALKASVSGHAGSVQSAVGIFRC